MSGKNLVNIDRCIQLKMAYCHLTEMPNSLHNTQSADFSKGKNTQTPNAGSRRNQDAKEAIRRKNASGDYSSRLSSRRKQGVPVRVPYYVNYSAKKKCIDSVVEEREGSKRQSVSSEVTAARRGSRQQRRPFVYRRTPPLLKILILILAMGSLPGQSSAAMSGEWLTPAQLMDKFGIIDEGLNKSDEVDLDYYPGSDYEDYADIPVIEITLPPIDPSVLSQTVCKYLEYKERCESDLREAAKSLNKSKIYCEGGFDNYMCWPYAETGRMAQAKCPDFYHDINSSKVGYRYCQTNGSWYHQWNEILEKDEPWRHIEECISFESADNDTTAFMDVDESETQLLTNLRIMYTVGYGVSLVCLVIALLLLAFFKRLHCTRNYIHMNLMVSFILRYVVILVKDSVLFSHYGLDGLADVTNSPDHAALRQYCDENNSAGWVLTRCRLVITLMHYAITANYFWLLAEGLYLQMLLVFVMSENKYFAGFMVFGWGAPWVSVLIWVALRMNYENSGCWDMNDEMPIWWTIRAPIIISIVINFFIFINIVRLIVSKLQAHNMARHDMKMRLAKSTLALIPLLGIHYIVFLALTEEVTDTNATPMHLRLAFDMFFSSIQGTLVSILYCFLNSEVRGEVKRAWNLWRSHKDLPRGSSNFRKSSTIVSGNHSTQVTQFYSRHSTTGGDIALQEACTQSPNSVLFGADSRANSIVARNSLINGDGMPILNGNGSIPDGKKNGSGKSPENDFTTTAIVTPPGINNETNGNIKCRDDVPFLQENIA